MYNPSSYVPTPLPAPNSPEIEQLLTRPTVLSAYRLCYEEEQRLNLAGENDNIRNIRVLGWMFIFATTHSMLVELALAVTSCSGNSEKYSDLGRFFIDFWIRPFRKYKGRTPHTSGHVSRPSFATVADAVKSNLKPYPEDHSSAKKNALIRDGFRCVVSGRYDEPSVASTDELKQRAVKGEIRLTGVTQCAHIICSSTNLDIENNEKKKDYAATAWAVLQRFGYTQIFKELNDYHDLFDTLQLWLEPRADNDSYRVGGTRSWVLRELPTDIRFENHSPLVGNEHVLKLPSKEYLALHAACAKVANLSGAADHLDRLDRDRESGTVLAYDGSSMDVMNYALWDALGNLPRSRVIMA
ncbi:hypothetical protein VKT23_013481 [Stygiomarasmius scandens]|uniref:HNH nuclease domain-containing protein n=1 Tax=Marasmiellus scandens TaxID=2682957 RepID=A0ABR1J876_9AGAR